MTRIEDFQPGQTVTILDYAESQHSDPRTGEAATVTSTYNGLVYVNRNGFTETFIPERLERCSR